MRLVKEIKRNLELPMDTVPKVHCTLFEDNSGAVELSKTANRGMLALYLGRVTDQFPSTYRFYNLSTGHIIFNRNAKFMKLMYLDHFRKWSANNQPIPCPSCWWWYWWCNTVAENGSGEIKVDNEVDTNNISANDANDDDLPELVIVQNLIKPTNVNELPELVIDQNLVKNNIPETINEWDDINVQYVRKHSVELR
jgi:hypothetical protein